MSKPTNKKAITLTIFVLMFFTSVLGFSNIARSYMRMGYAAVPWYIITGVLFFLPFAIACAEFAVTFKEEKGGLYSWMSKSLKGKAGVKFAFLTILMWYLAYVVWMFNVSSASLINSTLYGLSMFMGATLETLPDWLNNLNLSPVIMGVIGIVIIIVITFIMTRGLKKLTKLAAIGGIAVMGLNVLLFAGGFIILLANGFEWAAPITSMQDFLVPAETTMVGMNEGSAYVMALLGFAVYAIFAYGGAESTAGLVNEMEDPKKTAPRGLMIGVAVGIFVYSAGIIMCGAFVSLDASGWMAEGLAAGTANLSNVVYLVSANLGASLALALGASTEVASQIGVITASIAGLGMTLTYLGALFTLMYAPLKMIIEGSPKGIFPESMQKLNKYDMPANAMWVQAAIVIAMISLVSFTGGNESIAAFINLLVNMTNVAMTLPYIFILIVFIKFRKNNDIPNKFQVLKSDSVAILWASLAMIAVGFGVIFTILEPVAGGDIQSAIVYAAGPIIFGAAGWLWVTYVDKRGKLVLED